MVHITWLTIPFGAASLTLFLSILLSDTLKLMYCAQFSFEITVTFACKSPSDCLPSSVTPKPWTRAVRLINSVEFCLPRQQKVTLKSLIPYPSLGAIWFWTVQIILVEYQSFWMGPICFGQVQIILDRSKLWKLLQKNLIWTWPNNFDPSKTICIRPKQFERSKIMLDL